MNAVDPIIRRKTWLRTAAIDLWLKAERHAEADIEDAALAFLKAQRADVLHELRRIERENPGIMSDKDVADRIMAEAFDAREWDKDLREAVGPAMARTIVRGYLSSRVLQVGRRRRFPNLYRKSLNNVTLKQGWEDAPLSEEEIQEVLSFELPPNVTRAVFRHTSEIMDKPYWKDVNDTERQRMLWSVQQGVEEGKTLEQIADDIQKDIGSDEVRAKRIAVTECLPGDTPIDGANITAVYRRWYRGPLVKIITDAGKEVSGTPNHPMLTLRGWVALGDLQKSDCLIGYGNGIEDRRHAFSRPDDVNVEAPPTTIAEIFDSLAAIRIPERMRTRQPDFHGDGLDGEVDILRPDRILPFGQFTPITKGIVDGILSPTDAERVISAADGAPFSRGPAVDSGHRVGKPQEFSSAPPHGPLNGIPAHAILASEFHGAYSRRIEDSDLLHWQNGPGMLIARSEQGFAGLAQVSADSCPLNEQLDGVHSAVRHLGDASRTEPGAIQICDFSPLLCGQADLRLGQGTNDSRGMALLQHPRCTDSECLSDGCARHPAGIEIDRLAKLFWINDWSGHVYNLTTREGYFLACSLYTGNTTGALNSGHLASAEEAEEAGVSIAKTWITIGDDRVRETHEEADGQVVEGSDGLFIVGGYETPYPGHADLPAGERINCRCLGQVSPLFEEEKARWLRRGKVWVDWDLSPYIPIDEALSREIKYSEDQPRVSAGSPEGGQFGSGGGRTSESSTQAGSTSGRSGKRQPSAKVAKAIASHKVSTAEKQRHADSTEKELSRRIGGQRTDDNKPVDTIIKKPNGKEHGIELKTMLDNGNDKITMHPDSKARKETWAKGGNTVHTIVLDDRNKFQGGANKSQWSGNRIYYKRGVGSFRLGSMHACKDFSELKTLIESKHSSLPEKARR